MKKRILPVAVPLFTVSACSSMPQASLQYRLPENTEVVGSIVETARCDANGKDIQSVLSASSAVVSYYPGKEKFLDLKTLDGAFSNGSIGFSVDEKGQLLSINGKTEGQGGTIVKAAASVAASIGMGAFVGSISNIEKDRLTTLRNLTADRKKEKKINYCSALQSFSGSRDKSISATRNYVCELKPGGKGSCSINPATPLDASIYTRLGNALANLETRWGAPSEDRSKILNIDKESQSGFVMLEVNETELRGLTITANHHGEPYKPDPVDVMIVVPSGSPANVPIPRAVVFGTSEVSLELNGAGGIRKLSYNKTSGVAEALGGLNAIVDLPSATDQKTAAALKNRADVIAQQNRLLNCREDGSDCK